jgi:imidazolonepropionase-like amidohydrolase
MTAMQIVTASTLAAAQVCRLNDRLGTVESDKQADILVLTGNPLENLRELLNVAWVIRGGKIIRRPS